jgi:hypothetical protein
VGLFVQDADITTVWPVKGVLLLAVSEHTGDGEGAACQLTATYAVLLPDALPAVTAYVIVPAVDEVVEHWTPVQLIGLHE